MDIETNMEQIADQQDAFLDGWDDEVVVEETTETETEVEAEVETEAETEAQTEEQPEAPAEEETDTTVAPPVEETWLVKHMGNEQKLTKSDITPELLQKGMDYDRIRAKWDDAKPAVELLSSFAAKANMTLNDYIKSIRTEAKKASGMSDEEATRTIDLEDREAAVSAAEAERQATEKAENEGREKIQRGLDLFRQLYPDVYEQAKTDKSVIPESVWDAVNKGEPLAVAYKHYADAQAVAEKRQLEAKVAAAEQSAKNVGRSTGSMKSAGSDAKNTDPFLEGW